MWCGDEYKDRVVFLIVIDLLTHTTMWIEVPLMPQIYTMLKETLIFNLHIIIQDLSMLIAQDLTARNQPVCVLLPVICVTVLIATQWVNFLNIKKRFRTKTAKLTDFLCKHDVLIKTSICCHRLGGLKHAPPLHNKYSNMK